MALNPEPALAELRAARLLIGRYKEAALDEQRQHPPQTAKRARRTQLHEQIEERLPALQLIVREIYPTATTFGALGSGLTARWDGLLSLVIQSIGYLESADRRAAIFAPTGPQLNASQLHPWVWNAAVDLWDGNHHMQAVGEAAKRIDVQLQNKLGRHDISGADLLTQAFTLTAPKPGEPRLRFPGLVEDSERWKSAHQGAMHFGRGCMQGIRNWAAHDTAAVSEQQALEYLAALSVLCRWIEAAEVAKLG
jgi:hypothetical protein